jgi:hypothetical protein
MFLLIKRKWNFEFVDSNQRKEFLKKFHFLTGLKKTVFYATKNQLYLIVKMALVLNRTRPLQLQ